MATNKLLSYGLCSISLAAIPFQKVNSIVSQENSRPNIVIILADDQGYGDISFNPHSPPEVHTPYMDSLAREGVFFSSGYVTGNVCSPTRAGLMTGQYQQRAGIYTAGEGGSGLPLDFLIFPQFLKDAGYVSGVFGKWHLGLTPEYNPVSRGFDEFYGFMGRGAHDYFVLDDPDSPMYRGLETITDEGYLTTRLTEEAVDFIKRHKDQPFFCYLSYNAVHTPAQAPEEDIADFDTGDETRNILMAMLRHLDYGVRDVVKTLKEEGLWENTILFYLSDNGGAGAMNADNSPLRGAKQQNYEGGIRVPFIVSWPGVFDGGRINDTPVTSLDIIPTVLDAAGIPEPTDVKLDGKSIIPVMSENITQEDRFLFWSEGSERGSWAVRYGKWKLVVIRDFFGLYDLDNDIAESNNLITVYPDTADLLISAYAEWINEMADPIQLPGKYWSPQIETGSKATFFEELFYRGNNQTFSAPGIYYTDKLFGIGDNNTSSIVLATGYDALIFDNDLLEGNKLLIHSSMPTLNALNKAVSSFMLYPKGDMDMRKIDVTASASPETAPLVLDGNNSTYWDCAGEGEWIQFEFCEEVNIHGVQIAFRRGHLRKAFFDVEVSVDGNNWNKVISEGESSGTQSDSEFFSFPEVTAKYLRIIGNGNSDNRQNHYTVAGFFFW